MGGRGDWLGWRGCGRKGGLARLERVWEGGGLARLERVWEGGGIG